VPGIIHGMRFGLCIVIQLCYDLPDFAG
jgi:hypothetical protein